MTPEEFKAEMAKIAETKDCEVRHVIADTLLCRVLVSLGYQDGITIYNSFKKHHS